MILSTWFTSWNMWKLTSEHKIIQGSCHFLFEMPHPRSCSEVWEFSKKNVVKSLSGRLKTESEVSLWLQWPRAPLCALTTWTHVLLAKPDKENIVPWNWSSKTADATPLLTESRKYICGTRRDTSYALFIFGFSKLFSMTKCSRHVCCIKNKLNTNVKWNLTICRKYKLPEANPPKSSSEGRTLLEVIRGRHEDLLPPILILCPRTSQCLH